jgi:pimeloyl-ACP methyl ester carboxylesterase
MSFKKKGKIVLKHIVQFKKRYSFLLLGIFLLFASYFLFLLISSQIHFILNNEILITHDPLMKNYEVVRGEDVLIQTSVLIDPYSQCSVSCETTVLNLYDNSSSTQIHFGNIQISKNISTPSKGFGNFYVQVQTSCVTKKTFLCPSTEQTTIESSLYAVNFRLSDTEVAILENSSALHFQKIDDLYFAQRLLNQVPLFLQNISLDDQLDKTLHAKELWDSYEYERAVSHLDYEVPLDKIYALIDDANKKIELYNALSTNLVNIEVTDIYLLNSSLFLDLNQIEQIHVQNAKTLIVDPIILYNFSQIASKIYTESQNYDDYVALHKTNISQLSGIEISSCEQLLKVSLKLQDYIYANISTNISTNVSANSSSSSSINNSTFNTSLNNTSLNSSYMPFQFTIQEPLTEDLLAYVRNVAAVLEKNTCAKSSYVHQIYQNLTLFDYANFSPVVEIEFTKPQRLCCQDSTCQVCPNPQIPILFIHGHAFNEDNTPEHQMNAFVKLQTQLPYLNGGIIDIPTAYSLPQNSYRYSLQPLTFRGTYYYIKNYDVGDYSLVIQKSERIENYALRLRELIEAVKYQTGSPKVIIVAHSMGGLVAREYVHIFGDASVEKIITINTPHNGVVGRVAKVCGLFGAKKECEDMQENSIFLTRLQSITNITVIYSDGCEMEDSTGDGVVRVSNAYLKGASKNILINGSCTDSFQTSLHSDVLDASRYPQILEILVAELNVSNS